MPEDAPAAKLAAVEGYGAEITTYDRYSKPQVEAGREFAAATGMTFVPAYDDPRIAAGAGTAALELLEDAGPLDVLVGADRRRRRDERLRHRRSRRCTRTRA